MAVLHGERWCFAHHPAKSRDRAEARKRGGVRRRRSRSEVPETLDLCTAGDVRLLLETAVKDTLALENSVARNRTLAYLASVVLKTLEVGELEERLGALEKVILGDGGSTGEREEAT